VRGQGVMDDESGKWIEPMLLFPFKLVYLTVLRFWFRL